MFQTKVVEENKICIVCSTDFLKYPAVFEICRKNIVVRGRPQMTIWLMRIVCWILRATNTHTHTHTHRICNTDCLSAATWQN